MAGFRRDGHICTHALVQNGNIFPSNCKFRHYLIPHNSGSPSLTHAIRICVGSLMLEGVKCS